MQNFDLSIESLQARYRSGELRPSDLVRSLYPYWQDNKAAWVVLIPLEDLLKRCAELEAIKPHDRTDLWGIPFGVKDNVHVEGFETKCACKTFSWVGPFSPVVRHVISLGGIMVGKTNMDQFAAGLNGTRSPYGTARNAFDARFIPGGSSAGSGATVGEGSVTFAFGTDTAGSGRMPAHFNGCVGVKGTVGLISTEGVVPACRSLDCLTVFCRSPRDGRLLLDVCSQPRDRTWPSYRQKGIAKRWDGRSKFRFGVPQEQFLDFSGPGGPAVAKASRALFDKAVARLERLGGVRVDSFDFTPFADTAQLLYGSAWTAERVSGIRAWLEQSGKQPKDDERMEPIERVIMQSGYKFNAADVFDGYAKLAHNQARSRAEWDKVDMMITPTSLHHYTVEELERDEKHSSPANGSKNSNLGKFTNYMNLLDCCAVAVPSGVMTQTVDANGVSRIAGIDHEIAVLTPGGNEEESRRFQAISERSATLPWGVTLVAEAWGDQYLLDIADRWAVDSNLSVGPHGHHVTNVLAPLHDYFHAVNLSVDQGKEQKLEAIVSSFAADGVIIDQEGNQWKGRDGIRSFYSSEFSPVCQPGFRATPDPKTAVSNGKIIAVEITLTNQKGSVKVGDFFVVDNAGKVAQLTVYRANLPKQ